ncbi:MAG: GIY-YIG nuclease family protein [Streptomyces sp.]|nr:GIY-YIG nuclease family protein [Streptomyces sp.]
MTAITERTALYRLFDANGALLYVGITNDPEVRWKAHSHKKPWWPEVTEKAVMWFVDRTAAATAEARAIRLEAPLWNIAQPDEADPFRGGGGTKTGGRPATGQTPVITVRIPPDLHAELKRIAKEEGRSVSSMLIEAMHDRVTKKQRERKAATPERPAGSEETTG